MLMPPVSSLGNGSSSEQTPAAQGSLQPDDDVMEEGGEPEQGEQEDDEPVRDEREQDEQEQDGQDDDGMLDDKQSGDAEPGDDDFEGEGSQDDGSEEDDEMADDEQPTNSQDEKPEYEYPEDEDPEDEDPEDEDSQDSLADTDDEMLIEPKEGPAVDPNALRKTRSGDPVYQALPVANEDIRVGNTTVQIQIVASFQRNFGGESRRALVRYERRNVPRGARDLYKANEYGEPLQRETAPTDEALRTGYGGKITWLPDFSGKCQPDERIRRMFAGFCHLNGTDEESFREGV